MELVVRPKYSPEYNPETKLYEDVCPIERRKRITIPYYCLCGGRDFSTTTEFNLHITTQKHTRFLINYLGYIKDVNDAIDHAKELQVKYELTHRKMLDWKRKYYDLNEEYIGLKNSLNNL